MKVKLQLIVQALHLADNNWQGYFDTKTNDTVWVGGDPAVSGISAEDTAALIESDEDRFLELPSKWDINEYSIIQDFIADLPEGDAKADLTRAIRGSGAFRRFKTTVYRHGIRQQWFD